MIKFFFKIERTFTAKISFVPVHYLFTFPILFLHVFLLENLSLPPLVILSPSAEDFLKLSADQEQH